jgi:hypothetical protein
MTTSKKLSVFSHPSKRAYAAARREFKKYLGLPKNAKLADLATLLGVRTQRQADRTMLKWYNEHHVPAHNEEIEREREAVRREKRREYNAKRRAALAAKTKRQYMIYMKLKIELKRSGDVFYSDKNELFFGTHDEAEEFVEGYNIEDSRQTNVVEEYSITVSKPPPKTKRVPERKKGEDVVVSADSTYGLIDGSNAYDKVKHVCDANDIPYVNEGIGSVILNVLEKMRDENRVARERISDLVVQRLMTRSDGCCQVCGLVLKDSYEVDHIVPRAAGGSNQESNLQLLCMKCHREKTSSEQENGTYVMHEQANSVFSDIIRKTVIETPSFQTRQFVERVLECDEKRESYKLDINKTRRNILLHRKLEYPVHGVMDYPAPFSGKIQCGFFFVKTEQYFPLRGCGWYGEELVQYGLEQGMIEESDILYEFLPSLKVPASHFKEHINYLDKAFVCEPSLKKLAVNSMVGLFGKTKRTSCFSKFTTEPEEAADWLGQYEQCDVWIGTETFEEDLLLYQGVFSQNVVTETSLLPVYKLVLEREAIELHRLESKIVRAGGTVLDRNTDAIRYTARNKLSIQECWDDAQRVLKYKDEDAKPLTFSHRQYLRTEVPEMKELIWDVQYDYRDINEKVCEIIESNKSIHIDGRAGTGKTFCINQLRAEMDRRDIKYESLSPTNKGARLIGGKTIHSMYYRYRTSKKQLEQYLENVKYLFIDEVSMMGMNFYKLFLMIKMMFPKIRFIVSGDMAQLLPVGDEWEGDYKSSPALYSLCDGRRLELTVCRRSDDVLYNLCKNTDSVDINQFPKTRATDVNIAYTHETRKAVNAECMKRFTIQHRDKFISIKRDKTNPKTQDITLMQGMPVICHTTSKKLGLLNSDMFTVTSVNKDKITLRDEDRTVEIKTGEFNRYFYLGFCITIHASQGATFDCVYTIYDWNHPRMDERARYVALSRATNIANIQIVA